MLDMLYKINIYVIIEGTDVYNQKNMHNDIYK